MFYSVPWSYGTLGFLVAAELSIIPAKKYVQLEYTPITNRKDLGHLLPAAASSEEKFDFVETLLYNKDGAVLMKGRLTDHCEPSKVHLPIELCMCVNQARYIYLLNYVNYIFVIGQRKKLKSC